MWWFPSTPSSKLFYHDLPQYSDTDKLKIGVPAELQMKDVSLNWKTKESNNIPELRLQTVSWYVIKTRIIQDTV